MKPDVFTICLGYHIISSLLMQKCQQFFNESFKDAVRTFQVILASQEQYEDIG
jgi:hypothetical protein